MTESRWILGNLREFERNWEIPEESKGIGENLKESGEICKKLGASERIGSNL